LNANTEVDVSKSSKGTCIEVSHPKHNPPQNHAHVFELAGFEGNFGATRVKFESRAAKINLRLPPNNRKLPATTQTKLCLIGSS
jgi:hypothetical protein